MSCKFSKKIFMYGLYVSIRYDLRECRAAKRTSRLHNIAFQAHFSLKLQRTASTFKTKNPSTTKYQTKRTKQCSTNKSGIDDVQIWSISTLISYSMKALWTPVMKLKMHTQFTLVDAIFQSKEWTKTLLTMGAAAHCRVILSKNLKILQCTLILESNCKLFRCIYICSSRQLHMCTKCTGIPSGQKIFLLKAALVELVLPGKPKPLCCS